jgi:hypothetical protein
MCPVQPWCRVSYVLGRAGAPDLGTVDEVARLALMARRIGGTTVITDVSPALWALLELAGLRAEMEGQAELGEEPLGAQQSQEPRHTRDLSP